jgi:hypothetical protein
MIGAHRSADQRTAPIDTAAAVAACPLRFESGQIKHHVVKSASCQKQTNAPQQKASYPGNASAIVGTSDSASTVGPSPSNRSPSIATQACGSWDR